MKDLSLQILSCINFSFKSNICDGFYDLLHKAVSFYKVVIASVKENSYRTHF